MLGWRTRNNNNTEQAVAKSSSTRKTHTHAHTHTHTHTHTRLCHKHTSKHIQANKTYPKTSCDQHKRLSTPRSGIRTGGLSCQARAAAAHDIRSPLSTRRAASTSSTSSYTQETLPTVAKPLCTALKSHHHTNPVQESNKCGKWLPCAQSRHSCKTTKSRATTRTCATNVATANFHTLRPCRQTHAQMTPLRLLFCIFMHYSTSYA